MHICVLPIWHTFPSRLPGMRPNEEYKQPESRVPILLKSAACATIQIVQIGPTSERFVVSCAVTPCTPISTLLSMWRDAWGIPHYRHARTGKQSKPYSRSGIKHGRRKTGTRSVSARPVRSSTGVGQGGSTTPLGAFAPHRSEGAVPVRRLDFLRW